MDAMIIGLAIFAAIMGYFWRNFGTSTQGLQWQAGIDYIVNNIDKKYLSFKDNRLNSFTGMINGFFKID